MADVNVFLLPRWRRRASPLPETEPQINRSSDMPWGLPRIMQSAEDADKVSLGTRLARVALSLFAFFLQARIPAVLERPLTSRLWHTREVQSLARQAGVLLVELDQCQFRAKCKKPARLMFCRVLEDDARNLRRKCKGTRGLCSRTGRPHLQLEGSARARPAAAYLPELAHCIVRVLTASTVAQRCRLRL